MKKYKHKRTGWVVKEQLCWYDAVDRNTILNTINKEIVGWGMWEWDACGYWAADKSTLLE